MICHPARTCGLFLAVLLAGVVSASPQSQQEPYAPRLGQPGKDVAWVPTQLELVHRMLDMAMMTPDDYVIDLGSGDGITVITAAKRGAKAFGIEYDHDLVELSKRNAVAEGVSEKASFVKGDIFESDFSQATVITMFLQPALNMRLRPILLNLKPGTRIVSNTWDMEDWEADDQVMIEECRAFCGALLWIVPAKVQGAWQMPQGELRLEQKFQMISGSLNGRPISEGRLRGNEITFRVAGDRYTGVVDGHTIRGAVSGTQEGVWTATR